MNKLPIIKVLAMAYLAFSLLPSQAQDSVKTRPTHTVTKIMVVNPKIQQRVAGQPTTAAQHKPVTAAPSQVTGGTAAGATYRKPAASTYRQPAPYMAASSAPVLTDKSLSGQYQYLLTKVYGYQRPTIAAFYKNVTDSLNIQKRKVKELQASLSSQTKAVKDLQSDVNTKEESLNESTSKADSISLLGIPMSKASYNMLMWGLVLVFGVTAAIVIMQSGSNRREAKYRTKLYDDLDEEYKTYKIKANEKEKKLARELQTARNKLEEITGKPEY